MKYTVTIDARTFEVEIKDLYARPVVAVVDGVEISVEPECGQIQAPRPVVQQVVAAAPVAQTAPAPARPAAPTAPNNGGSGGPTVLAPIPGVIASVAVQPGDKVAVGQEVCQLEAMKMKNIIRASRAGTIGKVYVQAGTTVKHHDVLMDFAE